MSLSRTIKKPNHRFTEIENLTIILGRRISSLEALLKNSDFNRNPRKYHEYMFKLQAYRTVMNDIQYVEDMKRDSNGS